MDSLTLEKIKMKEELDAFYKGIYYEAVDWYPCYCEIDQ